MIETIYKGESNENKKPDINIRLPKNIRQIGQGGKEMDSQIYIEENVLACIKQPPYKENQIRYGVLLGDVKKGNGYTYIFINGMVEVDEVIEDSIIFGDEVWKGIYDNIQRYYREGVIVGWFASFHSDVKEDMVGIRKIHLDHFAGNNKVFLGINRDEDEEAFYIYGRSGLEKQPCYHVYFEKSVEFEDYIFGSSRDDEKLVQKEQTQREKGKYGIALNNSTSVNGSSNSSKESGVLSKITKEGEKITKGGYGKVASFATIIALAGVLGVMGTNGGLDALGAKVKGVVNGIVGSNNKRGDTGNIIEVDGVPIYQTTSLDDLTLQNQSSNEQSGQTTTEVGVQETTTEKDVDVAANESVKTEITTTIKSEEETTVKTQATISDINTNYASYTVKDGETLYSISIMFYGTSDMIDEIMALNKITDENYVMEGQKIFLP